jgi:Flp pilus assembly protein TadD
MSTLEIAIQHHQAGRLAEAETIYRQVLAVSPNNVDALNLLGLIAHQAGKNDTAATLFARAVALAPNVAELHLHLAWALSQQKRWQPAADACRRALELRPGDPEPLGYLGVALCSMGRMDEAIVVLRKAIAARPDDAAALLNLAAALKETRQWDEAVECCHKAIALQPNLAEAYNTLGSIMQEEGHFEEAAAAYRHTLELAPSHATAHWNLGLSLLTLGEIEEGFRHYEWRWKAEAVGVRHPSSQPVWDGTALSGKRILLHAEQGFGDVIQFCRYVKFVAEMGGKIILYIQPQLLRLLGQLPGVEQFAANDTAPPPHDVQASLLSLPLLSKTTAATVPAEIPYLTADTELSAEWAAKFAGNTNRKIGLAWAGSPTHRNDRNRSIPPELLAPLAALPGVSLISLQKRPGNVSVATPPPPFPILDWTADLTDFADTAALISRLDLVIAVDTAVAHLAGAMGKPVWMLLPMLPDWRWMLDRTESSWYPTMSLFRQTRAGDWPAVIEQVAAVARNL